MARASWPTCTARRALTLGLALMTASCSSRYQPQTGPRLSIVMDEGSLTYVRDGQKFKHGMMGGGLVEAVEDDPEAKEAAERYHSRMTSGFVLYLVGTGCLITGMVVGLSTIDERERHSDKDAIAAGGLLCGVAGLVVGASLLASGMPYQYDAVNIYNDNLERRRAIMLPPPAPPGYVPYAPVPVPAPAPPAPPAPPQLTPLGGGDAGPTDAGAPDGS
ncbi:MAG: hypothetical protein KJ015_21405 [Myxococcales bacterium]|nr:hypothetical protein [Myxococcales bacterium]